jgi:hypothetical protein
VTAAPGTYTRRLLLSLLSAAVCSQLPLGAAPGGAGPGAAWAAGGAEPRCGTVALQAAPGTAALALRSPPMPACSRLGLACPELTWLPGADTRTHHLQESPRQTQCPSTRSLSTNVHPLASPDAALLLPRAVHGLDVPTGSPVVAAWGGSCEAHTDEATAAAAASLDGSGNGGQPCCKPTSPRQHLVLLA